MEPPSSTGLISFLSTDLSEGDHTITVKVTDNESRTAEASIELSIIKRPDAVVLDEIEITDEGLLLNWSAYTHDDFESYRVLRIYYQAGSISHYSIDEIYDINTTTFLEDGYLELGETFYYRVDVVVTSGARSESNIQEIVYDFEHIDVETSSISRMLDDPSRAYLYVLDNENNELLFINKDSKTVEKSIFVGSFPNDMDMNDDYSKLYVANNGSSLVSVIDLNTQEKIQDLQVETQTGYDDNPLSIVWLKGDYFAYTIKTYGKIRIANAQTGALINASTSTQGQLLETNSTHDKVFTSTTNGLTVFEFENGHLIETSNTSNYSNYYNSIFVTDDDAHVFFGTRKFPTNNLDILLGTFDQTIGAINSDGSIAVGNSKIYNGNTFATIRLLPFSHSVKLITSDDKTLFYFEANLGKLYFTELE